MRAPPSTHWILQQDTCMLLLAITTAPSPCTLTSGRAQPYKPHSTLMAALSYTRKDPCRFLYHLPHTGIELLTATLCKVRQCLVVPACFCGLTRQWGLCVFTEHDKLPVQGLSGWMLLICNPVRLCTPFSVGFLVQLVRVAPSVQKCT